jgi:hypothetical protein
LRFTSSKGFKTPSSYLALIVISIPGPTWPKHALRTELLARGLRVPKRHLPIAYYNQEKTSCGSLSMNFPG